MQYSAKYTSNANIPIPHTVVSHLEVLHVSVALALYEHWGDGDIPQVSAEVREGRLGLGIKHLRFAKLSASDK